MSPIVTRISTDPSDVDIDWLHAALSERSYWALGRSQEMVEQSVANSLCFSALDGQGQVGFARVERVELRSCRRQLATTGRSVP